jgi:hypothetical protein
MTDIEFQQAVWRFGVAMWRIRKRLNELRKLVESLK